MIYRYFLAVLMIIGLLSSTISASGDCKCRKPAHDDTTREGANERVEYQESKIYKTLAGKVMAPNRDPLEDVLIEVFKQSQKERDSRYRITACLTDSQGRFCFGKLQPGRYRLQLSLGSGWNHASVNVTVNPKHPRSVNRALELKMTLGD